MRPGFGTLLLVALMGTTPGTAQEVGPSSGSLVVVGGGQLDRPILEQFIQLAGGPDAPIVVIPTAGEDSTYDQYWPGLRQLREAGATRLTVLHTRDRSVANAPDFAAPIREARGVWFPGGRQWRLADAYLDTRVHEALKDVLARGGVIGGTSAGATILGSYLVRGDTRTNTIMMGDHEVGFAFLRNVGIDQHLLRRNRHFDLIEVIEKRPELLGIGIDEGTAIVVRGDSFEVIGRSYVVIFDRERMVGRDGRFYFLAPGDRYNLKTREATRPATTPQALDAAARRPWPRP
jgi:cyanophycinase